MIFKTILFENLHLMCFQLKPSSGLTVTKFSPYSRANYLLIFRSLTLSLNFNHFLENSLEVGPTKENLRKIGMYVSGDFPFCVNSFNVVLLEKFDLQYLNISINLPLVNHYLVWIGYI